MHFIVTNTILYNVIFKIMEGKRRITNNHLYQTAPKGNHGNEKNRKRKEQKTTKERHL